VVTQHWSFREPVCVDKNAWLHPDMTSL